MSPHVRWLAAAMRPIAPLPAGMPAKLPRHPGLRAVVFDLYGTLLVSAAGGGPDESAPGRGEPNALEDRIRRTIAEHHARKGLRGIDFPEVEIREVWAEAFAAEGLPVPPPDELERLVVEHECRSNPVWPMPGASGILAALRAAGTPLGIVSNAQFYTPPTMEALFGAGLDALGFHPGLRVFSYEEGEGKPSPRLFQILLDRAADLAIRPNEILYLGNDLRKDVIPARAAGCFAALFAGDARSLRLDGRSPEEAASLADAVVTDLSQVPKLLAGRGEGAAGVFPTGRAGGSVLG